MTYRLDVQNPIPDITVFRVLGIDLEFKILQPKIFKLLVWYILDTSVISLMYLVSSLENDNRETEISNW